VKQEVGTDKPKVVINKSKVEWKKRQQEAVMVHQLEIVSLADTSYKSLYLSFLNIGHKSDPLMLVRQ
jgi:hypothetical protein